MKTNTRERGARRNMSALPQAPTREQAGVRQQSRQVEQSIGQANIQTVATVPGSARRYTAPSLFRRAVALGAD